MKRFFKRKNLFLVTFLAIAGFFSAAAVKSNNEINNTPQIQQVEAATVSKTRIVLELEDQCWSTSDSRDPILHIWSITVDTSMEYDTTKLKDEMVAASVVSDLEGGGASVHQINDDGSIDTGMSWIKQENNKRYWKVQLPWYIKSFTFKLHCGSYWSKYERSVTKHGSHMLYNYGAWNDWTTDITQDASSLSNTYDVTNYAITAASSGGVASDGHIAQVKGNGGSYTTSGNYFPRQKISLKATNGTYSSFDHWSAGSSTTSATTYDYVGTAAKTYTATFSDTRQKFTVVFKDYDGTTLETKTNVYQGSSCSPTSTPTRPDEGGKVFTFDVWRDSSGNDKTSALANVQSDLTVYASYTYSYKAARYLTGKFGDCNWGIDGAIYCTATTKEKEYVGTITLEFGDVFKSAYYNGTSFSSYYGYSNIETSCDAYHYFTNDVDDNIVCYARGTYKVYFCDDPYEGENKKISIALDCALNAEHLAAQLMALGEWEGHCGDENRFPAMRTIYLGLTSGEQTIFRGYSSSSTSQFQNAYLRYTAWARALGEDPWSNNQASAVHNFSPFSLMEDDESDPATIIIIVASSISLVSITALAILMVKKRKSKRL